jgi:hypothetical protein
MKEIYPLILTINAFLLLAIVWWLLRLVYHPQNYRTFFLQEFKRRKKTQNERNVAPPEGQMLAAMLIAQHQNNDGKPVYGAWITGSFWEFAILEGKTYHSSQSFDTVSHDDLVQIIFILRKLKDLILNR